MIRFVRIMGDWYVSKHPQFVDWSGKKPLWLARQCAILYALLVSLEIAFVRRVPVKALILATVITWTLATLLWVISWLRERTGRNPYRHPTDDWFALAIIAVDLCLISMDGNVSRLLPSLMFISYFYFSVCRNPPTRRPPKKKPKHSAVYWCQPRPQN